MAAARISAIVLTALLSVKVLSGSVGAASEAPAGPGAGTPAQAPSPEATGRLPEAPASPSSEAPVSVAPAQAPSPEATGPLPEAPASPASEAPASVAPLGDASPPVEDTVTGTIVSRQRAVLLPGDILEVFLLDRSAEDAPAEVLGSWQVEDPPQLPITFSIGYDARKVTATGTYVLSARVLRQGNLCFLTKSHLPVITGGHSRHAELVLAPAERAP